MSRSGVKLALDSFEVELALVPVDELFIHEEVLPDALERLIRSLREMGVFVHPVLSDKRSGVVLDGTHRVAAAKALGLTTVPCCLVDYRDERIRLERWFRRLRCSPEQALQCIREIVSKLGLSLEWTDEWEKALTERDSVCAVVVGSRSLVVRGDDMTPYEAFQLLKRIEQELRQRGITYDFVPSSRAPGSDLMLATRALTKDDVVRHALRRELFPPKTTRHVFPLRVMFLSVPLYLCESRPEDVSEAFRLHVLSREQVLFEARITLDRFYEEDWMVALI